MKVLRKEGMLDKVQFNDKLEWTWFYLWHHEGRRARHGAAMLAPDYAHWEGMYEVAHRFYMEFVPEVRHLIEKAKSEGKTDEANRVQAALDEILNSEMHRWFIGKQPPKYWSPDDDQSHGFTKAGH
jgi:hypothetical protein